MGVIRAICTSSVKGIQKTEVPSAVLVVEHGIEGDAHAGKWHRQVSLLGIEPIDAFKAAGAPVDNGSFGENLIVEGLGDLKTYPIGTQFRAGDALLELTQIGKQCHSHCAIYHTMGDCIMPREGVFTRVLEGGEVFPGTEINVVFIPEGAEAPATEWTPSPCGTVNIDLDKVIAEAEAAKAAEAAAE